MKGDKSRRFVTHPPSHEVLLTHQREVKRRMVGYHYVSVRAAGAVFVLYLGNRRGVTSVDHQTHRSRWKRSEYLRATIERNVVGCVVLYRSDTILGGSSWHFTRLVHLSAQPQCPPTTTAYEWTIALELSCTQQKPTLADVYTALLGTWTRVEVA